MGSAAAGSRPSARRAADLLGRVVRAVATPARSRRRSGARPPYPLGKRPPVYFVLGHAYGMGGTIRTVLNVAGELARRGYPVRVLSLVRKVEQPFFPFPPGVRVESIVDLTVRGTSLPQRLVSRARRGLSRVPPPLWPADEWAHRSMGLSLDLGLVRTMRRLPPGILVTTRPGLNVIAARLAPAHLVVVGQEHQNLRRHSAGLRADMAQAYPGLDALLVLTSRDEKSYAEFLAAAPTRVARIPNAVSDLGGGRSDPANRVIVAVGRMSRQKGFDRLLDAFAQVADRHPGWQLRIYGDGKLRGDLEAQLGSLRLDGRVQLLPPSRDVGAVLAAGSVYALSSRFEGFPLVLLEAMSAGLAVAAFNCPTGPADLVRNDRNGLLVKRNDVDALAAALDRLMGDEALRERLGRAALETVEDYTLEAIGDQWERFLDELVAEYDGRLRSAVAR